MGPCWLAFGRSCPSVLKDMLFFRSWNPAQLQQALTQLDEEEPCFEFRQQQLTVHRVHITFLPHQPPPPQPHDVTLVTQLSMDR